MISITMPTDVSTLADLRRADTIASLEVVAAIDAYMIDPAAGPYQFASGHSLDIPALVALVIDRKEFVGQSGLQVKAFRTKVAEIVMAAHPTLP
jgi:hypothetical protein